MRIQQRLDNKNKIFRVKVHIFADYGSQFGKKQQWENLTHSKWGQLPSLSLSLSLPIGAVTSTNWSGNQITSPVSMHAHNYRGDFVANWTGLQIFAVFHG